MDFGVYTQFIIDCMKAIWGFMLSNWLLSSALFAGLVLPKFVSLVRKTFGK